MKKCIKSIIAIALVSIMSLSLCACGNDSNSNTSDSTAKVTVTPNPASEAEKTVTSMLDTLKKGDLSGMTKYTTGDDTLPEMSSSIELGLEVCKPMFERLSYKVNSSSMVDDDTVKVNTTITSVDFMAIMSSVMNKAKTDLSIANDQTKIMQLMKDAAKTTSKTVSNTLDFEVKKIDGSWKITDNLDRTAFQNAIFGNAMNVIDQLQ